MSDNDEREDTRGEGFPQILHDRAREGAASLHRFLLSLSTGGVAAFFIAVTTDVDPPLSGLQQILVLVALVGLAVATAAGVIAWHADALRYYHWATALQASEADKSASYRLHAGYQARKKRAVSTLLVSFTVGIVSAVAYVAARVLAV